MNEFEHDNAWQRQMRDDILIPCYYRHYFAGRYELIDHQDPRAQGGCDTIVGSKRIDEKIVRWPRDENDNPRMEAYDAFALEVVSCSVPGRERDGWMKTGTVDFLLYCFADRHEQQLDCYLIYFLPLKTWFWAQDLNQWPLWTSTQINRTQCRIVPIWEVLETLPG